MADRNSTSSTPREKRKDSSFTNIALRKMRYIKKERFLADESFDAINATPVENADLRGAAASAGRAIIRRERRIETTRLEVLFNQSVSKY